MSLLRERRGAELDTWLAEIAEQGVTELGALAGGLQGDYAAVRAGLSPRWSNGQTEGQIHRLKMLKRQTYGRAGVTLMRQRVLARPPHRWDYHDARDGANGAGESRQEQSAGIRGDLPSDPVE